MSSANLASALKDWADTLGVEHVRLNDKTDPQEGLRTFGDNLDVPATIFPGSTEAVAAAIAIAAQHGVGVHPVSRGCNWGLGSRAPNRGGDVVIDLSRLNRISRFDAKEGMVHVEPGVSFIQLFEFLSAQDCPYFLPTIGGPVGASVLANALDRGDAVFCDRWKAISDLTLVLADGTIIETGHAPSSPLAGRGIPPAGPIVEGLFSQSNFGVVTGGWLRLEPLPTNISAWFVHVGGRDNLDGFVAAWRELQRDGTVPDRSFTLWNGIKFLAREGTRASYAPDEVEQAQLDVWYCTGFAIGETPQILAARDGLIETKLAPHVAALERYAIRDEGEWAEEAEEIFATPRQTNLGTVYWRRPQLPDLDPANPDRDGIGLLWICLALPLDGFLLRDFSIWCRARLSEADMDFNIGVEGESFRTALAYLTLSYERSPENDALALLCYQDILDRAVLLGFAPYRLANGITAHETLGGETRRHLLQALRQSLDVKGIIASGKAGIR